MSIYLQIVFPPASFHPWRTTTYFSILLCPLPIAPTLSPSSSPSLGTPIMFFLVSKVGTDIGCSPISCSYGSELACVHPPIPCHSRKNRTKEMGEKLCQRKGELWITCIESRTYRLSFTLLPFQHLIYRNWEYVLQQPWEGNRWHLFRKWIEYTEFGSPLITQNEGGNWEWYLP